MKRIFYFAVAFILVMGLFGAALLADNPSCKSWGMRQYLRNDHANPGWFEFGVEVNGDVVHGADRLTADLHNELTGERLGRASGHASGTYGAGRNAATAACPPGNTQSGDHLRVTSSALGPAFGQTGQGSPLCHAYGSLESIVADGMAGSPPVAPAEIEMIWSAPSSPLVLQGGDSVTIAWSNNVAVTGVRWWALSEMPRVSPEGTMPDHDSLKLVLLEDQEVNGEVGVTTLTFDAPMIAKMSGARALLTEMVCGSLGPVVTGAMPVE